MNYAFIVTCLNACHCVPKFGIFLINTLWSNVICSLPFAAVVVGSFIKVFNGSSKGKGRRKSCLTSVKLTLKHFNFYIGWSILSHHNSFRDVRWWKRINVCQSLQPDFIEKLFYSDGFWIFFHPFFSFCQCSLTRFLLYNTIFLIIQTVNDLFCHFFLE